MARHPTIARALGLARARLDTARIEPGTRITIACSGGADSVALVGLLSRLARGMSLRLSVAHVDHGLRPESGLEARQVAKIAVELGLGFRVMRLELERGSGLAERAREARYGALWEMATSLGGDFLALGHTGTDQVETMLMHLARGAGLEGMAGMATRDRGLLRPMLDLTRDEARELAIRMELPFVDDPTNLDEAHPRVAVRRQVLPVLRELNPKLELAFARASVSARAAEDALDELARAERQGRRVPSEEGAHWSLDRLHERPMALRTRVLRGCLLAAGVDRSRLGRDLIEELDGAAVRVARHAGGQGTGEDLRAREWDLHPHRRARIDRNGLTVRERDRD